MSPTKYPIEKGIMKGESRIFDTGKSNLGNLFLETFRRKPNFVGQINAITGEEFTYQKMEVDSVRCAWWLRENGMKPGDIVITFTYNHMLSYLPFLATWYNRGTLVSWNYGNFPQLIKFLLNLINPKFAFVEEKEAEMILKVIQEEKLDTRIVVFAKISGFDCLVDIINQGHSQKIAEFQCSEPLSEDDDCVMSATSGTTGDPKITVHSYKAIMEAFLITARNTYEKRSQVVSLSYLPLAWLGALVDNFAEIIAYVQRIIISETSYDVHEAFQFIQKYKVTEVNFGLGMLYRMYKIKELSKYNTSSVKFITTRGIKLNPEILKFLMGVTKNGQLRQRYGFTEFATPCFMGVMNGIDLYSSGYLHPNVQVKVIDVNTGKMVGPGQRGEFCFKSPYLMKGYFKNEKDRKKAIDSEGWFHSSDLGYYNENGLGYVLGRVNDTLMVHNGKCIDLWDVRRTLYINTEIVDVAVVPVVETSDPYIVAFVTVVGGSKVLEKELEEMVKSLSGIVIPTIVKIVDNMPLTTNGKIILRELQKIASNLLNSNN